MTHFSSLISVKYKALKKQFPKKWTLEAFAIRMGVERQTILNALTGNAWPRGPLAIAMVVELGIDFNLACDALYKDHQDALAKKLLSHSRQ